MNKLLLLIVLFSYPIIATNLTATKPFSTIFSHGLNAGPIQAAKYIPEHTSSITGENITCANGINVLHGPITAPAMSEIKIVSNDSQQKGSYLTKSIQRLKNWSITRKHVHEFGIQVHEANMPDGTTLKTHSLDRSHTNIGQAADIEKLRAAYYAHQQKYPDHESIMYGCSRGAAVAFSFICQDKPNIKAAVFEGCFDSVPNVLAERYGWLLAKRGVNVLESLLERYMAYKKVGVSPLSLADQWPQDLPALFVTSVKDTEVPTVCTQNLINEIKKHVANDHIYVVTLEHSTHPRYVYDNAADKERYENAVHAFYKLHGIDHDEVKASKGAMFLKKV